MPTSPTPIDALPTAPDRSDRATFSARATAFFAALKDAFVGQVNALASNAYANAVEAAASAVAALTSANNAAASAATAIAAAGATIWVSGTTYAIGDVRYSPANQKIYRRKTAGAGTTDPSADSTNWGIVSTDPQWVTKTTNYTAVAGDALLVNTTSGAITITLPASPSPNDTVRFADYAGTWGTNKVTFARNGSKIMGLSEDYDINTPYLGGVLTYIDSTQGWIHL